MFIMTSEVRINQILNPVQVHSIKWNKSIYNLADTCTLTLPAKCRVKTTRGEIKENMETAAQLEEGLLVTVACGYKGAVSPRFQGFILRMNYAVPLEVECEGYSYLLRKVLDFNKNYKRGDTMHAILSDLVAAAKTLRYGIQLSDRIPEVILDSPVTFKAYTGMQVLEWIKTNLYQTVYFNNDQLYVGPEQADYKETAELQLGWNTIRDKELRFAEKKEFAEVAIRMEQRKQDGSTLPKEYNGNAAAGNSSTKDADVKVITMPVRVDEATLQRIAEDQKAKLKYAGYQGTITTFLQPYIEPAMAVNITDEKYPERKGRYLVTGVEGEYGPNGGRVKVKIGNTLGNG